MTGATESGPSSAALLASLDTAKAMRELKAQDRDAVIAAITALADAKVSHWTDGGRNTADQTRLATEILRGLSVSGAVLFGDLANVISGSRGAILLEAIRAGR